MDEEKPRQPLLGERAGEKRERKKIMKCCENHDKCVVVFDGDDCPLCNAEKTLKNVWEEIEKSTAVLKELKKAGEETGLKIK